jgi:hypothetical protein
MIGTEEIISDLSDERFAIAPEYYYKKGFDKGIRLGAYFARLDDLMDNRISTNASMQSEQEEKVNQIILHDFIIEWQKKGIKIINPHILVQYLTLSQDVFPILHDMIEECLLLTTSNIINSLVLDYVKKSGEEYLTLIMKLKKYTQEFYDNLSRLTIKYSTRIDNSSGDLLLDYSFRD